MQRIGYQQLELNPFTVIGRECFLLTPGTLQDWSSMTAGWGGLGYVWGAPAAFIFVHRDRPAFAAMEKHRRFSLSFFPPEMSSVLELFSGDAGSSQEKAALAGLTPQPADGAVAFSEANLVLACTKIAETALDDAAIIDEGIRSLYSQGDWHRMFIGRIDGVWIS